MWPVASGASGRGAPLTANTTPFRATSFTTRGTLLPDIAVTVVCGASVDRHQAPFSSLPALVVAHPARRQRACLPPVSSTWPSARAAAAASAAALAATRARSRSATERCLRASSVRWRARASASAARRRAS
eukprot:scaffold21044_cov124-Isochrysis_galbana.AAC.1